MSLALQALSGPLKNQVFVLEDGLTLGRQGANITLNDPKISSLHARILKKGDLWVIEDNNSKNGLRVHGEKANSITLRPGISFLVGDSEFTVIETQPKAKPKPSKQQRYWHQVLTDFVKAHGPELKDQASPVSPLDPALVLEFVRGTQVNAKWILGFGPRKIGAASVDLPIWEPGAPPICFEILPSASGLVFKTSHPEIVRLNGEGVDSRVLHMGDTISILDTLIEVDFAE